VTDSAVTFNRRTFNSLLPLHSLPYALPPSHIHLLPPSLPHTFTYSLPPSLTHSLTPSSLSLTDTFTYFSPPHTHIHLLPPHSHIHSLPPSLTHSLTHLTNEAAQSLRPVLGPGSLHHSLTLPRAALQLQHEAVQRLAMVLQHRVSECVCMKMSECVCE
jgi:hypothetical protein